MKNEVVIIGICMIFVSMALGCSFFGGGVANETKLDVEQGLGVVGTLQIDELNPGLDGYIALTVRNNVGGESASRVYVSLDNVEPFKLYECGAFHTSSSELRNCTGTFSLDKGLPYRTHGESKMFPGQELEFFWRIRAPTTDEISNIALRQTINYDLEYDYKTTFVQNIIFMSYQERLRRSHAGESYNVEGEASSGAGELRVTGITPQPVGYQFADATNFAAHEEDFSFNLQYSVKNEGNGLPRSDVVVLFEIPRGKITPSKPDIAPDNGSATTENLMAQYGWYYFNDLEKSTNVKCTVNIGEIPQNCTYWIRGTYGNDFKAYFDTAAKENRLLVKIVPATDFINEFTLTIPLKFVGGDTTYGMTGLKYQQIPLQIYAFKVHNMYRYFTEGSSEIVVYPIKV